MENTRLPNAPAFGTEKIATPSEFLLSEHVVKIGICVSSAARDAGNSPTTTLRPGLVLGKITASGKYAQYDPCANDGTEVAVGMLYDEVKVLDSDGNAMDAAAVLVLHGYVDTSALIGIDDAARTDMAGRVIFD